MGTNLMCAKAEITERTTKGKGIFVDLPTSSVRDFAQAWIPMTLPAAKDLLANGSRLVYDVILDTEGSLLYSRKILRSVCMNKVTASVFLFLSSSMAFARNCPNEMKAIDPKLTAAKISDAEMTKMKALREEGEKQHKAGNRGESMKALREAKKNIGHLIF